MQSHEASDLAARHLADMGSRWAHVQAVGRLADALAAAGPGVERRSHRGLAS